MILSISKLISKKTVMEEKSFGKWVGWRKKGHHKNIYL
jgi:hypothetical protein